MAVILTPAERNELAALRRRPERELTAEERVKVFGAGNANRMLYARSPSGAGLIQREFAPGEAIPEGWEDSPAAFGLETEPARAADGALPENALIAPNAVKMRPQDKAARTKAA